MTASSTRPARVIGMASSHLPAAIAPFAHVNQVPLPRIGFAAMLCGWKGLPAIHSLTEELADENDIRPGGGYRDPVLRLGMYRRTAWQGSIGA